MDKKITSYIGLGGNIGNSVGVLQQALELLRAHSDITDVCVSSLYRSEAVSSIVQRDFINAVCSLKTHLAARDLFALLEAIEQRLGKIPKAKDAPRPIDLDLLLYGQEYIKEPFLQVPHPRWSERLFVLLPLAELTPEIWVAGAGDSGHTIALDTLIEHLIKAGAPRVRLLALHERIEDICIL